MTSHNGHNYENCGNVIPCLTIGYTLQHCANANDIIKVDNEFESAGRTFNIQKSFPFKENLTIVGINGMPVISSESHTVLFDDRVSSDVTNVTLTNVTLTVINIWFKGVAISRFTNAPDYSDIKILRCVLSHLRFSNDSPFIDKLSFIMSENSSPINSSPTIMITVDGVNMFNFSQGIILNGVHIILYVINSSFINRQKDSEYFMFNCPIFAQITNVLSLKANFSSVTCRNVLSINEFFQEKMLIQVVNIIDSSFYGDENFSPHFCRSGIMVKYGKVNLRNCTVKSNNEIELDTLFSPITFYHADAFLDNCNFVDYIGSSSVLNLISSNTTLNNCTFTNITVNSFGVIRIWKGLLPGNSSVTFHHCSFVSNSALEENGVVTIIKSDTRFMNCNFKCNTGGAAVVADGGEAFFKNCSFDDNLSTKGGAVFLSKVMQSKTVKFDNCYFANNRAKKGGAIYAGRNFSALNCVFKGNKASSFGGSIWHDKGNLNVANSTFVTLRSNNLNQTLFGDNCIYSTSTAVFQNVSVTDLDNSNDQSWLISVFTLRTKSNVKMQCNVGKKITVNTDFEHGDFGEKDRLQMTNVLCSSCPSKTYSLSAGSVVFKDMDYFIPPVFNTTHIECFPCPFGGVCDTDQIHASDNFWGYPINKREVRFVTCPYGYCCTGWLCKSFNSCAEGRHGRLCSACVKNLTENMITSDCLDPKTCFHPEFWAVFSVGGILYFFMFMYMKDAVAFLKYILCPNNVIYIVKNTSTEENENPLLADDGHMHDSQDITEPVTDEKSNDFFPGLFKIMVFFYQASVLYKVQGMYDKSRSSVQIAKEILATVFNLRTDGLFYQKLSWCPFTNVKPVPKVFLKLSFIFYLLLLVLLTYFASRMRRRLMKAFSESKSLDLRLLPCCLRIILISYAAITSGLFSCLTCVPLHYSDKVLFIDGSISCYQWWQIVIILIVAFWVACFPVALYTSSQLLHSKKMSIIMFLLSLAFPLASILYWIHDRICAWANTPTELHDYVAAPEGPNDNTILQEEISKEVLDILEGPFRKANETDNSQKIPWESVIIARLFVLIVVKAIFLNTVSRLYVMFILSVLFLAHHLKVQPFYNTILNYVESGSLFVLVFICGINIIPGYNSTYDISVSPFSQGMIQTFSNIETALLLIFPFATGCSLALLFCVRIFQLLFWLCAKVLNIICACLKRKSQ